MHPIDQVTKQLHKLVNVIKIRDLEPADTVARELALFKISADGASRGEVMQVVEIFRGKIIDVTRRSVIVEMTGTWEKVAAFERMVRPFGLVEMARTGEIAISGGRGGTGGWCGGAGPRLGARRASRARRRAPGRAGLPL